MAGVRLSAGTTVYEDAGGDKPVLVPVRPTERTPTCRSSEWRGSGRVVRPTRPAGRNAGQQRLGRPAGACRRGPAPADRSARHHLPRGVRRLPARVVGKEPVHVGKAARRAQRRPPGGEAEGRPARADDLGLDERTAGARRGDSHLPAADAVARWPLGVSRSGGPPGRTRRRGPRGGRDHGRGVWPWPG